MINKEKTKPGKECYCCKKVREGTTIEDRHVCTSCNHIEQK